MSKEPKALDAAAVTPLPGRQFTLTPVIRHILRTRYCIPGTVFLVEGLKELPVSTSGRWKAIQLLLGDGELCIQALLGGAMFRFVQTGEVALGSYVRCYDFQIKWHKLAPEPEETNRKSMVYLKVERLATIGWNESYRSLVPGTVAVNATSVVEARAEAQASRDDTALRTFHIKEPIADRTKISDTTKPIDNVEEEKDSDDEAGLDDAFESFEAVVQDSRTSGRSPKKSHKKEESFSKISQPIALPRDWRNPQTPLKLTTLRSIPHLPYAQNWSCNVLAIVTSLSPVEPSNLPPHKQRTARIADPSTAKHVHLTVFLNPEAFTPRVGSAILLVGVKNHRFDGGSLKKYASDKKEGDWWFEEPWDLAWCDVAGIKSWWTDMQQSLQE